MRTLGFAAVAAAFAVLPALAAAQDTTSTSRIDKRQEYQQKRIDKGVQSGALTEKEAERLRKRQDRIQSAENKAAADGTVTAKERRRIEHMQDRQSKAIAHQKHDRQRVK
jgi:hypothetical protein